MGILKCENVDREYITSKGQLGDKAQAGRSAGGDKTGLLGRKKEKREKGDSRILGSGDFVSRMLHEQNLLLLHDDKDFDAMAPIIGLRLYR
jgi:hypothetical protein